MSTVKFVCPEMGYGATIEVDGNKVENVRKVTIICEADQPTKVIFEYIAVEIDALVEADPEMDVHLEHLARARR